MMMVSDTKGVHGYDNQEASMRSIFIGYGPFARAIKAKQLASINAPPPHHPPIVVGKLPMFSNLEVFSLLDKLLALDSAIDLRSRNCSVGFWDQFF